MENYSLKEILFWFYDSTVKLIDAITVDDEKKLSVVNAYEHIQAYIAFMNEQDNTYPITNIKEFLLDYGCSVGEIDLFFSRLKEENIDFM